MNERAFSYVGHGGVLLGGDVERAWASTGWGCEFDAIIPLGGNCAAAHNLRMRGLRSMSFPFDWVLMDDPAPIAYLARGFANGFSDLCLRENLVELTGDERGIEKPGRLQFKDKVSGWKFIHHFNETSDFDAEYCRVSAILKKRIRRMQDMFESGGRFLLILAPNFMLEKGCVDELRTVLKRKYPRSTFCFLLMSFRDSATGAEKIDEILYVRIPHAQSIYDFSKTTIEWSFLDRLRLKVQAAARKEHKLWLWKWNGVRYILKWHIMKKIR